MQPNKKTKNAAHANGQREKRTLIPLSLLFWISLSSLLLRCSLLFGSVFALFSKDLGVALPEKQGKSQKEKSKEIQKAKGDQGTRKKRKLGKAGFVKAGFGRFATVSGKGPDCVADPFGNVPCRCFLD